LEVTVTDPWQAQREALGAFIRTQRQMANLSLRQLAELTSLSNPYLSQVERGLHQPSVRVLKAISDALNLSAETMLAQAGLFDAVASEGTDGQGNGQGEVNQNVQTEDAIRTDARLSDDQKAALIAVYRSMLGGSLFFRTGGGSTPSRKVACYWSLRRNGSCGSYGVTLIRASTA
jgi:transcriptional regulator with XRE-family HTH domain